VAGCNGYIYLITERLWVCDITGASYHIPDMVAFEQLNLANYLLIEIDSRGIYCDIIRENVIKSTTWAEVMVLQRAIDPKYLSLYEERVVNEYNYHYFILCLEMAFDFYLANNLDQEKIDVLTHLKKLPIELDEDEINRQVKIKMIESKKNKELVLKCSKS
jgi:hypothetical protein